MIYEKDNTEYLIVKNDLPHARDLKKPRGYASLNLQNGLFSYDSLESFHPINEAFLGHPNNKIFFSEDIKYIHYLGDNLNKTYSVSSNLVTFILTKHGNRILFKLKGGGFMIIPTFNGVKLELITPKSTGYLGCKIYSPKFYIYSGYCKNPRSLKIRN